MATEPTLVAEVLSPSTRDFDTFDKLDEYKSLPTVDYVLLIEPNAPEAILWSRAEDRTWVRERIEGLDARVEVGSLGLSLAMADLYDGVEFTSGPRLIRQP